MNVRDEGRNRWAVMHATHNTVSAFTVASQRVERVRRTLWLILLLLVASVATGCATTGSDGAYVAPTIRVRTPPTMLRRALEESAQAHGLTITRTYGTPEHVIAYSGVTRAAGQETRDRWEFTLLDQRVEVVLHPEVRNEGDTEWNSVDELCHCYYYSREHEMLRDIRSRARRARRELEQASNESSSVRRRVD